MGLSPIDVGLFGRGGGGVDEELGPLIRSEDGRGIFRGGRGAILNSSIGIATSAVLPGALLVEWNDELLDDGMDFRRSFYKLIHFSLMIDCPTSSEILDIGV
jgi:hypothetical protein